MTRATTFICSFSFCLRLVKEKRMEEIKGFKANLMLKRMALLLSRASTSISVRLQFHRAREKQREREKERAVFSHSLSFSLSFLSFRDFIFQLCINVLSVSYCTLIIDLIEHACWSVQQTALPVKLTAPALTVSLTLFDNLCSLRVRSVVTSAVDFFALLHCQPLRGRRTTKVASDVYA